MLPEAPKLAFGSHLDEKVVSEWAQRVSEYSDKLSAQVQATLDPWNTAHSDALSRIPVLTERVESLLADFRAQSDRLSKMKASISDSGNMSDLDRSISLLHEMLAIESGIAGVSVGDDELLSRAESIANLSNRLKAVLGPLGVGENLPPYLKALSQSLAVVRGECVACAISAVSAAVVTSPHTVRFSRTPHKTWAALRVLGAGYKGAEEVGKNLEIPLRNSFLNIPSSTEKVEVIVTDEDSDKRSISGRASLDRSSLDGYSEPDLPSLEFKVISNPYLVNPPESPTFEAIAEALALLFELLASWTPQEHRFQIEAVVWKKFLVPGLTRNFRLEPVSLVKKLEKAGQRFGLLEKTDNLLSKVAITRTPTPILGRAKSLGLLRALLLDSRHRGISVRIDRPGNFEYLKKKFGPETLPPVISNSVFEALESLNSENDGNSNSSVPIDLGLTLIAGVRKAECSGPGNFLSPEFLVSKALLVNDLIFLSSWSAGVGGKERLKEVLWLRDEAMDVSMEICSETAAALMSLLKSEDGVKQGFTGALGNVFSGGLHRSLNFSKFTESAKKIFSALTPVLAPGILNFWASEILNPSLIFLRDLAISRPSEQLGQGLQNIIEGLGFLGGGGWGGKENRLPWDDIKLIQALLSFSRAQLHKLGSTEKINPSELVLGNFANLLRANPRLASADPSHILRLVKSE